MSVLAVCRVVSCRIVELGRGIGSLTLVRFLSAPISVSETGTIGKPMKRATEYIETVGEGLVRTEKRALVCRLKIVYNAACLASFSKSKIIQNGPQQLLRVKDDILKHFPVRSFWLLFHRS